MKKYIYVILLSFGIISCSSDNDINIDNTNLTGKWIWVSSCGGFTGGCWYPNEDNFESIEFKDGFIYIKKINGIIDTESNYIITDTIINGPDKLFKIEFQNGHNTYFRFIDDNLSIEGGDFWIEYSRILK